MHFPRRPFFMDTGCSGVIITQTEHVVGGDKLFLQPAMYYARGMRRDGRICFPKVTSLCFIAFRFSDTFLLLLRFVF